MSANWPLYAGLFYLILINGLTLWVFAFDKKRAIDRGWRVKEDTLLLLAFLGGSIAAKRAQRGLRHKTRKQPFGTTLNVILIVHLIFIVIVFYPLARVLVYYAMGWPMDDLT